MKNYWLDRHRHAVECSKIAGTSRAGVAYEQLAAHYLSMYHWLEKHVRIAELPHSEQPAGRLINS